MLCGKDEKPTHRVKVETFEIGRYEMPQELWEAVMGSNPSAFNNCPMCPVDTVSWDDVHVFLDRLNAGEGKFRLPSEAEWEYAARGGRQSRGHPYAGSGGWTEVAWYFENSGNRTNPVGQLKANEPSLFDMSGNVREWVQDCYQESYQGAPSDGVAWESENCNRRVMRSGSWYGKFNYVRTANRFWYGPNFRNNNFGFRLARTIEEQAKA